MALIHDYQIYGHDGSDKKRFVSDYLNEYPITPEEYTPEPYPTGIWIEVTEDTPFPRQSKEFLVRNDAQGGTLKLVYWNKIHSCFMSKGESIPRFFGTHFMLIPK